jgi:transcriptional regulator with PAS, ATPase and Fis domain
MSEIKKKYNNFDKTLEECKLVLDELEIIVVDEKGKIKYITETILKFIEYFDHVDMTNAVGKYIQDIHPVSRIPHVLSSGKAEEEWFYFSAGELDIARINPFYKNGKLKGVIDYDLFTEEKDFRRFFDKVIKYSLDGYIDLSKSAKDFMKTHNESQTKYTVGDIIGNSLAIKRLRKEIYEIAESDTTVLITGETGCGKEFLPYS